MTSKSDSGKNNLWVFRDGKKNVNSGSLLRGLTRSLSELPSACSREQVIPVLLLAGELECGLADAGSPGLPAIEQVTDALASAILGQCSGLHEIPKLLDELSQSSFDARLTIAPAEGFAYYALHPNDFARLALETSLRGDRAVVIGIRTIGATLSAITAAALRVRGVKVERLTVRPVGHPYGRETRFTEEQKQRLQQQAHSAEFLVADEGPGRSGSSFLSVGEALERQGIPPDRITFLGSRAVDPAELCADNAARRWNRFRFFVPCPHSYDRFRNDIYIGGGRWRSELFSLNAHSPACWPQMERLKFLSADRRSFFKFEGFGDFGESARQTSLIVADAGFGSRAEDADDGMTRYPVVAGSCAEKESVSGDYLERMAKYCAFRSTEFRRRSDQVSQLQEMVRFNVRTEFGIDLHNELECLTADENVLVDGRMQPYEWIRRPDGVLVKVDANTHGDDHFFPGPTDVAWDLAGAMVEWQLEPEAADFFMQSYNRLTGDQIQARIQVFALAYAVFRFAYCEMALATAMHFDEVRRFEISSKYYRGVAVKNLQRVSSSREYSPALGQVPLQERC